MSEYVATLTAVVSGIFLIVAGAVTWKLKSSTDEKDRALSKTKERREELKLLYSSVFVAMEQTIKKVLSGEDFSLDKEMSSINAKVRLLASKPVEEQYCEVAALVAEWSELQAAATPRRMVVGDQTVTILQAPDPTAKFKKPAEDAYEKLQSELEQLVELMRNELHDA